MYLELRGNRWNARYTYNGERYRISDPSWTKDLGKRQVARLAEKAVEKEMEKREQEEEANVEARDSLNHLADQFLNQLDLTLKTQTAYNTRHNFEKHIRTAFDMKKNATRALTFDSVERFRIRVSQSIHGSSAINHVYTLFRQFIDYLCLRDALDYSKGAKLKAMVKSVSTTRKAADQDKCFWTVEEWNRFISTFDPNTEEGFYWKTYFDISYWCALRIGEALALRFEDFDYEKKTLTVSRSIDSRGNITMPKTASSSATIQVRSEVIDEVIAFQEKYQMASRLRIFWVSRNTVRRTMNAHADKAGIRRIKVHGLRHSMASRMINSGVNILMVSRQLRHSSTDETLKTYSHLFPNTDRGTIDKL